MAGRFIDFDAARAEREDEPLSLRAYGKTFELPGSMSAALLLDLLRMEEEHGAGAPVPTTEAIGLLRRVLPASVLEELLAAEDFRAEDFVELAGMVIRAYSGVDDAGEAPAPNREARRHPPSRRGSSPASSNARKKVSAKASPGPQSSKTGQ